MTSQAPEDLLAHLRDLGILIWADDGDLAYDAPPGAMSPELRSAITRHKAAILAALKERPAADATLTAAPASAGASLSAVDQPDFRLRCKAAAAIFGFPRVPLPHRPAECVGVQHGDG